MTACPGAKRPVGVLPGQRNGRFAPRRVVAYYRPVGSTNAYCCSCENAIILSAKQVMDYAKVQKVNVNKPAQNNTSEDEVEL